MPGDAVLCMDTNQQFEQFKNKYQSVLDFISQQPVQLQNLNVQDDKLLIRAVAPFRRGEKAGSGIDQAGGSCLR